MQLAASCRPSVAATAGPRTPATAPSFSGGIDYAGTAGRFTRFSAHATDHVYGDAAGYATLQAAIDAATFETIGARQSAAGIFELDGRFHARRLDNELTFASSGQAWSGVWRLEQYPADLELLDGRIAGVTRSEALRAIVDGAQRIDVTALPVAPPTPR
jgi:hypothetical protein